MTYWPEVDENLLAAIELQDQYDAEQDDLAYAIQVQDELNYEPLVVQEEPRTSHLPFTQLFDNLRINTNNDNEIEQRKDPENEKFKQFQLSETEKLMDEIMQKLAIEKQEKQQETNRELENTLWGMVIRKDTEGIIQFLKNNPEHLNEHVCIIK